MGRLLGAPRVVLFMLSLYALLHTRFPPLLPFPFIPPSLTFCRLLFYFSFRNHTPFWFGFFFFFFWQPIYSWIHFFFLPFCPPRYTG